MRPPLFSVRWLIILLGVALFGLPRQASQAQETSKAMLAVIGVDGNLSVYDANARHPFPVTRDAQPGKILYQWPTWSTDGRLAFFGASADAQDPYSLRVFVQDQVKPGGTYRTAYSSLDEVFTYAYWSPGDCLKGNCRDLALLYTPPAGDGLGLRLIRDENGTFTHKQVGIGAPYYFSFSPDGQRMIWYRNASQFDIYDTASDRITQSLDDAPGKFQAPMWSPVDDRILFAVAGDQADTSNVVVADGEKRTTILSGLDSPVSFAWSPDATLIAVVSNFHKLTVLDAKSARVRVTAPEANIVAHFWSPRSDRIAYVVLSRQQPDTQTSMRSNGRYRMGQASAILRWYVLNVTTGRSELFASFAPTRDMVYLLNFFDQFARSHSLWSPDGRYLVYAATDSAGKSAVMLLDMQNGGSPTRVADGTMAVWSWK